MPGDMGQQWGAGKGLQRSPWDPPSLEDRPRHLLPHLTHLGTYGSAEARWP